MAGQDFSGPDGVDHLPFNRVRCGGDSKLIPHIPLRALTGVSRFIYSSSNEPRSSPGRAGTSLSPASCLGFGIVVALGIALSPGLQASPHRDLAGPTPDLRPSMPAGGSIEPTRHMRAEGYPWEHELQIALPASYRNGYKSYPVLWVTDGQFNFDAAVKIVYGSGRHYLPEMIVVGIGVPPEALKETQMRRVYDFSLPGRRGFDGFGSKLFDEQTKVFEESMKSTGTPLADHRGGAPIFLKFLVDQVRPALSKDYRMSADHTLYGHSGGGLFCTYVLLARPESFNRYLCTSPNLYAGNYELFRMEDRYAETHSDLVATVFFGAGEGEVLEGGWISAWGTVSSTTRMAEILRLRRYPSLKLSVRIFPGANHSANAVSLEGGLRTLWESGS